MMLTDLRTPPRSRPYEQFDADFGRTRSKLAKRVFIGAALYLFFVYTYYSNAVWGDEAGRLDGVRPCTLYGLVPFALVMGLRHILLAGAMFDGADTAAVFFEVEAGGASVAVGVGGLAAGLLKLPLSAFGVLYLVYAVYIAISFCVSVWAKRPVPMLLSFAAFIFLLASTAYLCLAPGLLD